MTVWGCPGVGENVDSFAANKNEDLDLNQGWPLAGGGEGGGFVIISRLPTMK